MEIMSTPNEKLSFYGLVLKGLRLARGLSLSDVELITGIKFFYLSKMEHNVRIPTNDKLKQLCDVYQIDVSDFFNMVNEAYENNLTSEEIFLLCAEYESKKHFPKPQIKEEDIEKMPELILKAIDVVYKESSSFIMSKEDIDALYQKAIKENLSYAELIYYCLLYDINRKNLIKKQQESESKNLNYEKYVRRSNKPRYVTPVYEIYDKIQE